MSLLIFLHVGILAGLCCAAQEQGSSTVSPTCAVTFDVFLLSVREQPSETHNHTVCHLTEISLYNMITLWKYINECKSVWTDA